MFIGLESQFLDICKKIVPALHKYYDHQPGARESDSSKSTSTPTKFTARKVSRLSRSIAKLPELQCLALKTVEEATIRRWRYME